MPHTSRKRSGRGSRARKFHRSGLGTAENTPKQTPFSVTFVWGEQDLTPRTATVTPDRRRAMRIARSIAERGARIVLVKKGDFKTGHKLVADFSTVGGA